MRFGDRSKGGHGSGWSGWEQRGQGWMSRGEVSASSSEVDSVWIEHGGTFLWLNLVGS